MWDGSDVARCRGGSGYNHDHHHHYHDDDDAVQKTILGYIGDASTTIAEDACELAIRLIYLVGEHGTRENVFDTTSINEFHQVLEPVMYERLSKESLAATSSEPVAVRLLLTLIAAMTKLAACWPDLLPRVRLCLTGKVLKQRDLLPVSVVQSTAQRLQLLKFPRYGPASPLPSRAAPALAYSLEILTRRVCNAGVRSHGVNSALPCRFLPR